MRIDPKTQCDKDVITHRFYADLQDARDRRPNAVHHDNSGAFTMIMGGTMLGVLVVILLLIEKHIDVILGWLA